MKYILLLSPREAIKSFALIVGVCGLLGISRPVYAQTSTKSIGVGLGLFSISEDKDFESKGSPVDVFFDFGETVKLRAGINTTQSQLQFDAYQREWKQELKTDNIYLAYRSVGNTNKEMRVFALAGLAYMRSELNTNNNVGTKKDAGFGVFIGTGAVYQVGSLGIGAQLELFSRSGEFGKVTVATGSNQIQGIIRLDF